LWEDHGVAALGGGKRIKFRSFDAYWAGYLWAGKPYEPDVEAILSKLSPIPDKLFVDCGANIAYWTVRVSDPSYGFSEFIAIEANPALIPLIQENIRLNGINCELINKAIGEHAGKTVCLGGTHHHASAAVGESGIAVETVNLSTILEAYRTEGRTIVVKLDVEGCEVAAIKGAAGVEGGDIIYIAEDWPKSGMLCTSFLLDHGYAVIAVSPEGAANELHSVQDAIEFNAATTARYQPSNVIGCRKDHAEALLRFLNGH
jgi:FkbM family methyltransferase